MSVCTSIEKVATDDGSSLLKVTVDNTVTAFWFYDYSAALQYLNKDVIVDYRQDIYKGNLTTFIKTFVIPTEVTTLSKQDNIKLYCDQEDNFSNLSFNEIEDGETRQDCIVYCISQKFNSSRNATWQELLIRDRSMHVATLRIFNYVNKDVDFTGSYVKTELSRNQYGFRSDFIIPADVDEVHVNPEIPIAKQYINNYFHDDVVSMELISNTRLLDYLEEDIDYEKGYGLVRLAMELAMVENLNNITKAIDIAAIGRAALASRLYITKPSSVLSKSVINTTSAMHFKWDNLRSIVLILDEGQEEKSHEYVVLKDIQHTIDSIIRLRKGIE